MTLFELAADGYFPDALRDMVMNPLPAVGFADNQLSGLRSTDWRQERVNWQAGISASLSGIKILANPSQYVNKPVLHGPYGAQCAFLLQRLSNAKQTTAWKVVEKITKDNIKKIPIGAAVATMVNGKYPQNKTGQHSGYFMGATENGWKILEQYVGLKVIQERELEWDKQGSLSNQGSAYSIISW